MSLNGLIGRKISMTTFYHEDGTSYPVTVVKLGPCVITQVKTLPRDGYEAVQIGFMEVERINKPLSGPLNRSGGKYNYLREFSSENLSSLEVGQEINLIYLMLEIKLKLQEFPKVKVFLVR